MLLLACTTYLTNTSTLLVRKWVLIYDHPFVYTKPQHLFHFLSSFFQFHGCSLPMMTSTSLLAAHWMAPCPSWHCPRLLPALRWPWKVTEAPSQTLLGLWATTSLCQHHSMGLCVSGTRRMVGASGRSETLNPASCSAAPSSPWITISLWWVRHVIICVFSGMTIHHLHLFVPQS